MGASVHRRGVKRLVLRTTASRWRSSWAGDVLVGGIPLYDRLPGRIGSRESIGRRCSVLWGDVSWGGRWLPEVLHWSELFMFMVTTVIGVLVMLARSRSMEG